MSLPDHRPLSRSALLLAMLLLLGGLLSLGASVTWTAQNLMLRGALLEGRAVADMAENVGRWASQYGGVHIRTQGVQAKLPGSYLTRSTFEGRPDASGPIQGAAAPLALSERTQLDQLENFFWKNPALIQREVADTATSAGSRLRWRLTARTVLNPNNRPQAFELEALDHLQAAKPGAPGLPTEGTGEYWRVDGGQLLYARAVVAQASCLKCHDRVDTAPEFLRSNALFNGGGGYGYRVGQAAGLISVAVPLPSSADAWLAEVPPVAWAALAAAGLSLLAGWLVLARRR